MARTGRPRLSDEEKKLRGTFQPCRSDAARAAAKAAAASQPTPPALPPPPAPPAPQQLRPPPWLSPMAKAEWTRVVRDLDALGRLARVDLSLVAGYCAAVGSWRKYQAIADKTPIVEQKNVGPREHPAGAAARKWLAIARQIGLAFGLSPTGRTALALGKGLPVAARAGAAPEPAAPTPPQAPPPDTTKDFLFGGLRLLPGTRPPASGGPLPVSSVVPGDRVLEDTAPVPAEKGATMTADAVAGTSPGGTDGGNR